MFQFLCVVTTIYVNELFCNYVVLVSLCCYMEGDLERVLEKSFSFFVLLRSEKLLNTNVHSVLVSLCCYIIIIHDPNNVFMVFQFLCVVTIQKPSQHLVQKFQFLCVVTYFPRVSLVCSSQVLVSLCCYDKAQRLVRET